MKNKFFTIAISIIVGLLIGFFSKKNANSKIQNKYDSLKNEVFIKDLYIMRYENIIEKISKDTICKRVIDEAFYETE
jgi:hypothetical protein